MAECIIPMKSVTYAEKAKRTASAGGIGAEIVNIDPTVTRRGCAYGLAVSCGETDRLTRLLDRRGIPYGEVMGGYHGGRG